MTVTVNINGLEPIAEAVNNLARVFGTSAINDLTTETQQMTHAPQAEASFAPQMAASVQQPAAAPTQQPLPVQQAAQQITTVPTPPASQAAVPTSTATYTLDDLSRAGMTLMDSGRQNDLLNLLTQFGVTSLPDLPAAQYGAFATALRGLGAKI